MTKGNKTASYTYDMSGVRSSKVVNGVSYEYTTLSGKITRMTWSGNAVDIVYDDAGRPYLLRYTPSGGATQTYYYVLNLQGDVVGLMNTSMQMVVKYSYDPWGKLTGTTATSAYVALAQANPLRYRSYCYDIETGFYYLQTRYYDPAIARFINADGYLSTGATGLLSYNMFAYCENNPVMYSDIGGSVRNYCVNITDGGGSRSEKTATVIYYSTRRDFTTQATTQFAYSEHYTDVKYIPVETDKDLIEVWKSLEKTDDVYVYLHGEDHALRLANTSDPERDTAIYDMSKLSSDNISGTIYLFSCHGYSVAPELAKSNNCNVVACDNSVSYSYYQGKAYPFAGRKMRNIALGAKWDWYCVSPNGNSQRLVGNCFMMPL